MNLPRAYVRSIEAAGGVPVLIPVLSAPGEAAARLVRDLDGLLFTGGGDLDPGHFGEDPLPELGRVEPDRDAVELALAREALRCGLPLLAICRGTQVLNVAAGGDLYQDLGRQLPQALQHSQQAPRWHGSHDVQVEPGSRLAAIMEGRRELRVNSFHHQAVRRVADGLTAVAHAPDGVVEAVEAAGEACVLGVQWHPEGMWKRHPQFLSLFTALIKAAQG